MTNTVEIKAYNGFVTRLKEVVGKESIRSFAKKCDISDTALRQYLSGKSEPTRLPLIAIARAGMVNIEWLVTGIGSMRKVDEELFNTSLLALIIELLEEKEKETNKELTPFEKADFISDAYGLCFEIDPTSDQAKNSIRDYIKAFNDFLSFIDKMIETEVGMKKAQKFLAKKFEAGFSKYEAEFQAEEFIGSRLLKRHLEKTASAKGE
jgi:transcriptional regulator with XRE-family HTH domain